MKKGEDIVDAIDNAAFRLLQKIGGEDNMSPEDSAILAGEFKAFGEIVKWAEIRPGLIPKADQSDAKFSKMKDDFHANGRAPRGRRTNGKAQAQSGSASAAISLLVEHPGDEGGIEASE